MATERTNLLLRFGSLVVGEIVDAFYSDNTGYGVFRVSLPDVNDPTIQRLREYVAFSETWHIRLKEERPHSASEWDEFKYVCDSGLWNTVDAHGTVSSIGGPVFAEGEVSWRPAEPGDQVDRGHNTSRFDDPAR